MATMGGVSVETADVDIGEAGTRRGPLDGLT